MKLVAVTRILNESDIVEAFVRHTAAYVDHHLVLDNGSVDGTLEILRRLKRDGIALTLYQTNARSFIEDKALTYLFRRAVIDNKADWVLLLDTDEFIDDRALGRSPREYLAEFASSHAEFPCVGVRLRDYQITPDDAPHSIVPCRMTHCGPITDNTKVIARADLLNRRVAVRPGSHSVRIDDGKECPTFHEESLVYAHYPTRSPYQWLSKCVIGWSKVLASGPEMLRTGHAIHYRDTFETLRKTPRKLLRNPAFLETLTARPGLTHDPIAYRGGDLKYTGPTDYPMRTVQVIMQYLHDLATQHGELLEPATKIGDVVRRDEADFRRLG